MFAGFVACVEDTRLPKCDMFREFVEGAGCVGGQEKECVRVFFPFILGIKFVGRTSRGHTGGMSHMIFHPPSFCGGAFIFLAKRIQPFLSLVDRDVEFCVLTI